MKILSLALLLLVSPGRSGKLPSDVASSADKIRPLSVGAKVPVVPVRNLKGDRVSTDKLLSRGPTVLIFYRGGWCPYCNVHMGELAKLQPELKKMGVQILAVSPDRPEELRASVKKNKIDYQLLSDSDLGLARKMGLAFAVDAKTKAKYKEYKIDLNKASGKDHGWLPVPAVFLVDSQRTIQFQYVNPNYKVRLKGDLLLAAVKSLLAKP